MSKVKANANCVEKVPNVRKAVVVSPYYVGFFFKPVIEICEGWKRSFNVVVVSIVHCEY
jgi:hypothetical protein